MTKGPAKVGPPSRPSMRSNRTERKKKKNFSGRPAVRKSEVIHLGHRKISSGCFLRKGVLDCLGAFRESVWFDFFCGSSRCFLEVYM